MFGKWRQSIREWKLRTECSECGVKGSPHDEYHYICPNRHGIWDASAEFIQAKILIKEKNTVKPTVGWYN